MPKRPEILKEILKQAETQKKGTHRLKAIFDLDSTLFDVSPRIAKILNDFAADPEMVRLFPNEVEILKSVEANSKDYGVRRTLQRYGFVPPSMEFAKLLVDYWKKYFFGDEYLQYDQPYPGAQQYLNDLFLAGAEIKYLTGRDIPRMLRGTIKSLKQNGFPIDDDHANVILKPNKEMKDTEFKRDFFLQMNRSTEPVWFFENEPANIYLVARACPHINIIFVETVHSEKMPPPGEEILKISGFEY